MNKLSYISNKYKENDIEGEDFGAELYNILNLPQKNLYDKPYNAVYNKRKKILHCSIERKETKKDGFKVS